MVLEYNEIHKTFHDYGIHEENLNGWETIEKDVDEELLFIFTSFITSRPDWNDPPLTFFQIKEMWNEFIEINGKDEKLFSEKYLPQHHKEKCYVHAKDWGYDYNLEFPPHNGVFNHYSGYDTPNQEDLFYRFAVLEGEDWHIAYKGEKIRINRDFEGKASLIDEDWKVLREWKDANTMIKELTIKGKHLYEIVDDLDYIIKS